MRVYTEFCTSSAPFRYHLSEKHLCIAIHLPWKKGYMYSWLFLPKNLLPPLFKYVALCSLHVTYQLPYLLPVQKDISSKWMRPHCMQGRARPQQCFDPKSCSSCSKGGYRGKQTAAVSSYIPADTTAGCRRLLLHKDKLLMVNLFNFKLYQRRELSCSQVCDSQELERTQPLFLTHPHWVFTGINCMTAALPLRAYTFRLLSDYQLA